MKALLWYWHYGDRRVSGHDSLDDAIEAAIEMGAAGTGSLEYIEHDGQRIMRGSEEYRALVERRWQEDYDDLKNHEKQTRWRLLIEDKGREHILESFRDEVSAKAGLADVERDFPDKNFRLVKKDPK